MRGEQMTFNFTRPSYVAMRVKGMRALNIKVRNQNQNQDQTFLVRTVA